MVPHRLALYVGLAAMLSLACDCGMTAETMRGRNPAPPNLSKPATSTDVSGVWEGTALNDCSTFQAEPQRCNATVNITLTMLQDNGTVTGFYKCATGTMMCYHFNETGVIKAGWIRQGVLQFRVMLEDGESCIFQSIPQPDRIYGGYLCLNGSAIIERGNWDLQRAY